MLSTRIMKRGLIFSVLPIALCIHICSARLENAKIGFELLKYDCLESLSQQVCLIVTGYANSNFYVGVSTQEGIAAGN